MKKRISILVVVLCFIMAMPVFAMSLDTQDIIVEPWYKTSNEITVQLNGKDIDFTDEAGNKVVPQLVNDRTMVPMRKIFEEFGATVEWFAEDRSIKANKDGLEIWLQIDNTTAKVTKDRKTEAIILDSAPIIVDGRTLVPVRFIAESLNLKVGWDSWDRTVIIIDTSFIEETLKTKTPNLYSLLTEEYQPLESYDMTVEVKGDVAYTENKEKESVNFKGTGEIKYNPDAMSMEGKLVLKGKGEDIEEALAEIPGDIEGSAIIDFKNFAIYFKSPLLNETGYFEMEDLSKWVKMVIEDEDEKAEFAELIEQYGKQSQNLSITELVDTVLTEDYLYTETYGEIEELLDAISIICSDNYLKVKETSKGKVYSYELGKDDIKKIAFEVLSMEYGDYYEPEELRQELDEELEALNLLSVKVEMVIKDKVATSATVTFDIDVEDSYESYFSEETYTYRYVINIESTAKMESYNQDVTIKMPADKDTVKFEDVYVDPWAAMMERIRFSSITMNNESIDYYIRGMRYSVPEISQKGTAEANNYIAQGYGATLLSKEEAEKISCTRIAKSIVEEVNYSDEEQTVKTADGEKVVSFYITPKGNVFFWPPFVLEDVSYVAKEVTVKDAKGNEFKGTDATKAGTKAYVTFANDEKIEVTTKADGTYTIKDEYIYEEKEPVVEAISPIYENARVKYYYLSVYEEPKNNSSYFIDDFWEDDTFTAQKYSNGWSRVSNGQISGWAETNRISFPNEVY